MSTKRLVLPHRLTLLFDTLFGHPRAWHVSYTDSSDVSPTTMMDVSHPSRPTLVESTWQSRWHFARLYCSRRSTSATHGATTIASRQITADFERIARWRFIFVVFERQIFCCKGVRTTVMSCKINLPTFQIQIFVQYRENIRIEFLLNNCRLNILIRK